MFKSVTGVILAGGKSRRYGKNKALIKVQGIPLIERVVGVMASLFESLILVTNSPEEYRHLDLPMYRDLIKGIGPIGGIYTAVTVMPHEAGFFVACDMPSLNRGLIRHMVEIRDDFDVVVPRLSDKIEALHALYHKRCLDPIEELITSGNYQTFRFFGKVYVRYVEDDEVRRFDPKLSSFYNINRPQELEEFEEI